jgi:hypothetical protein
MNCPAPENTMNWEAIATLLLAFVTVVLVIVTVFGDWIQGLLFKPRILLEIDSSSRHIWLNKDWPEDRMVSPHATRSPPTPPAPQGKCYWIRMGIKNLSRRCSVAGKDIEIFVSSIVCVEIGEKDDFVGFNLK